MDTESQIKIDGRDITDGKRIVPVELRGAINSPRVSGGLIAAASGST